MPPPRRAASAQSAVSLFASHSQTGAAGAMQAAHSWLERGSEPHDRAGRTESCGEPLYDLGRVGTGDA